MTPFGWEKKYIYIYWPTHANSLSNKSLHWSSWHNSDSSDDFHNFKCWEMVINKRFLCHQFKYHLTKIVLDESHFFVIRSWCARFKAGRSNGLIAVVNLFPVSRSTSKSQWEKSRRGCRVVLKPRHFGRCIVLSLLDHEAKKVEKIRNCCIPTADWGYTTCQIPSRVNEI